MRSSVTITIVAIIVCLAIGALLWPADDLSSVRPEATPSHPPETIVSLAPSITETLFALGLGDRVVGVTRFCIYPPEARTRPVIGGFEDVNYEAIAAIQPDLIVVLDAHSEHRRNLEALGRRVLEVKHERVEDILASMVSIADICGVRKAGEDMVAGIRNRMESVARRAADREAPRVLLTLGGALAPRDLSEVYIAGTGGYYDSMIRLAGGRNAYTGSLIFPTVSPEGILQMKPDVIIDLLADLSEVEGGEAAAMAKWEALPDIPAVTQGRAHLLVGDYVLIPGPRFIQTLEAIADIIHPPAQEAQP